MGRVRVGDTPHEAVASDDGKLAFASNYGGATPGNSISVIDLAAQKELHRVDLGPLRRPHGLAYADGKLYFTCETNKIIGRYDPATNTVDWLLGTGQTGTHMVELSKDRRQIYRLPISAATASASSTAPAQSIGSRPWSRWGKGPEGFDITPDGKELWVAHSRDGGVSIITLSNKSVAHTFSVQTKRSNRLKFTPDGRLVLISDLDAGELVVLEHATRKQLKRIPLGKQPAGILITPDSSRAYVAVTGDNNVAVIDLKSLELVDRIQTGTGPDGMAWIP